MFDINKFEQSFPDTHTVLRLTGMQVTISKAILDQSQQLTVPLNLKEIVKYLNDEKSNA